VDEASLPEVLPKYAVLVTLYWMMISIAGYWALWQPAFAPFLREKTPRDGRRNGPVNAED